MGAQTFRVTATPRQRFVLANCLFHRDLKFRDRARERDLYRARKALGLLEVSERLSMDGMVSDFAKDNTTRNTFEVTHGNADFLVTTVGGIEKPSADLLYLEEVLEQLEDGKKLGDGEQPGPVGGWPPAVDEAAEAKLWRFSALAPQAEKPLLLAKIFLEAYKANLSFGAHREAMIAMLEPPKAEEAEGR
jgi:hypothetical protein